MMSTRDFYYEIDSFKSFSDLVDEKHYKMVPDDWYVIITDVKGSTKAIEEGRYKDVNTIGAATIITIQNAVGRFEFPFVFGGDGATILIPQEFLKTVSNALLGLKQISQKNFGLELRTGLVKVSDVMAKGGHIEIAKYQLTKGKNIALFRGGGLTLAEELIKGDEENHQLTGDIGDASLLGLSCRWQPIPNKRGKMLSLLVMARENNKVYKDVLNHLTKTIAGNIDVANPINTKGMNYRTMMECYQDEKRYQNGFFNKKFLARLIEMLAAYAIFYFKIPLRSFNRDRYIKSMATHSDFRKFDDMLRMVLDCSPKEITKIKEYLERLRKEGKIFYGTFESDTALMTCFVPDISDGKHIHFIDGGDGGYAMAAKQLKEQLKLNA